MKIPLIPPPNPTSLSRDNSKVSSPTSSNLKVPIALQKAHRSCAKYPLSNVISFDHLSISAL